MIRRQRIADEDLARRAAAGDDSAFAAIDDRHRLALIRYARSLLRRSDHDAEDVVQDVLIRAHTELRAGDVPTDLRPWLYRLTRNRSIDEVRRARWGAESLPEDDTGAAIAAQDVEPDMVLSRRESLRRLVEDLADLPPRQREALLARELDGLGSDEVAARLGVSVPAAQMLTVRARESLVRTRAARDADCPDVRTALALSRERGEQPGAHVEAHLRSCAPCQAHDRDLRRVSRRVRALAPPIGLAPVAAIAKLLGGGASKGAVAAAVVVAASGGVIVLSHALSGPGDPAPFQLQGVRSLVGRGVKEGASIPAGTAVVTARVRVPAGAPKDGTRSVTLACPAGMRVAGLQSPEQRLPLGFGLSRDTIIGSSTRARITFTPTVLAKDADVTVGALCRTPGSRGSLSSIPREPKPGERPTHVCAAQAYVYKSPGKLFVGTVFRGQPVSVQRTSDSGQWVLLVSDIHTRGWVKASALQGC